VAGVKLAASPAPFLAKSRSIPDASNVLRIAARQRLARGGWSRRADASSYAVGTTENVPPSGHFNPLPLPSVPVVLGNPTGGGKTNFSRE
jgi:hypothetical protein